MSRCFPYPPPGFTKKASDVSTLIDSIKPRKENKANQEKRKEKRRDKGENDNKEKKRERKEKKESVDSKVAHEAHKDGKNWTELEGVLSQKRKLDEAEQLEGSSVTEEHGEPLNLQNPSYSSDATQNINKRRKQASVVASDSRGDGNIIQQSDVKACEQIGSGSDSLQGFPSCRPSSNEFCSTSGNVDDSAQGSCFTSQDKKMLEKIAKYDSLVRILYQMAVPSEVADSEGEDWLFRGKHSDTVVVKKRNVEKQLPVNSRVTCSGSSSLYPLYPRARYLEEAKIYALPYTVPF